MRHLTVEQRAQIVGMSMAGSSNKSIARAFAIDMKTVARWINRYQLDQVESPRSTRGWLEGLDELFWQIVLPLLLILHTL